MGHHHPMDVVPLDRIANRSRLFAAGCLGAALAALAIAAVQTWRVRDEGDVRAELRDLDGAVQALHHDLDQLRAASERERAASDAALRAGQVALERTRAEAESLRAELAEARGP